MANANTSLPLNTGAAIPALGLGTWQSAPGEVSTAVETALLAGYTHIDAAYCYGNEEEVGAGLAAAFKAGVKRENIFVTTKLWCTDHTRVEEALDRSLGLLGLDYVDLYLVHWPVAMNPNGNHPKFPTHPDGSRDLLLSHSHLTTWKAMEGLPKTSKARAIGVCNYSVRYLTELVNSKPNIMPAVNQIENHPQLPQQEIVDFCKSKGIHVTAYSPLGSTGSPLMELEVVKSVASKYGVKEGVVLLSWHVKRGSSVLAKSVTPARIKSNMEIIELDDGDMEALAKISKEIPKRYVYPAFGVDFGFPDKS